MKYSPLHGVEFQAHVALYERAWIEMLVNVLKRDLSQVALYERAWIEIKIVN
ncbi:hypothetical protein AusDCA_2457 [Desulfitobacterium sp. AusDCA]